MASSIYGPESRVGRRVEAALNSASEALEFLEDAHAALKDIYRSRRNVLDLEPAGKRLIIVGDLHGDYNGLRRALAVARKEGFPRDASLVFLGDYVDRGPEQLRVFYTVLALQMEYPEKVVLLRGNHEPPEVLPVQPHDYPAVLMERYPEAYKELYNASRRVWEALLLSAYWPSLGLLALHGGLPTETYKRASSLLEYLGGETRGWNRVYTEILWNDPTEHVGFRFPSMRGVGYEFGPRVTSWVRERFGVSLVVRGHQSVRTGYMLSHGDRVLTVFSRTGPPYYNDKACIYVAEPRGPLVFDSSGLRCFEAGESLPE